ncbi:MAG: phosphate ABC transporter permease subunit PstC [Elusimicrobia bacterium]|nr:phosphate ABC transporter permease subunit PstC [Elusimicrobiota bacterium]MDE2237606.1 phosphate ABC transporter permease subunit PstC [Elusimicrobiota bacterium]MDE2426717.1 phosphate ABC transporter permease subunit PstC [Elusimicrobiota bacterium]
MNEASETVVVAGPRQRPGDRFFRYLTAAFGLVAILLAVSLAVSLWRGSQAAWLKFGPHFIVGTNWNPVKEKFGALPFIYGTLVSSLVALVVALPLGVGSAIFLSELASPTVSDVCSFLIELLAAVPSVILGLMGIFVLVPVVRAVEPFLSRRLGFLPLFRGAPYGVGLLAAGLILALMILPYITVITREVLLQVPKPMKEAMLALGATHWETVWGVSLPYARSGIAGALFLSLGRALGETMAVTMVIGNTPKISASLFDPAYSMAAVIANELAEAVGDMHLSSLVAIGLTLFGITVVINGLARLMLYRLGAAGK